MKLQNIGDLRLQSGEVLKNAQVAYLSFGKLNEDRDNVVLVTHGLTSGPQMLLESDSVTGEGTWNKLVGPGLAIDTDKFYVVCPNMLGSAYGSTGPASINPFTAAEYGPHFPKITVSDIVASQRKLLRKLQVNHLRAVVGPSYGGIQALQWALDFPEYLDAIGVIVSGPRFPPSITAEAVVASLSTDPNWNDGHYYRNGGIGHALKRLRGQTLLTYGMREVLADQGLEVARSEEIIDSMAEQWGNEFDGNSLVTLIRAGAGFDVRETLPDIAKRILWVSSQTDIVFPPNEEVIKLLSKSRAPIRPIYAEIESSYGHVASGADYLKWERLLSDFLV